MKKSLERRSKMFYKEGDTVMDLFNREVGVITRIQVIAGMDTYFVLEGNGKEYALYENEIGEIK
jgi:hypothetical protein